jgi:hypothetical protein
MNFVDSGHFALKTHAGEIAAAIKDYRSYVRPA